MPSKAFGHVRFFLQSLPHVLPPHGFRVRLGASLVVDLQTRPLLRSLCFQRLKQHFEAHELWLEVSRGRPLRHEHLPSVAVGEDGLADLKLVLSCKQNEQTQHVLC